MGQRDRLKGIADAIRDAKGTTEKIKASNFASEISNVFQAGEKSEYDRFVEVFFQNGKRKDFKNAFAGENVNLLHYISPENLPIKPIDNANSMAGSRYSYMLFGYANWSNKTQYTVKEITDDIVDFSETYWLYNTFACSCFDNISVDFSSAKELSQTFSCSDGGSIKRIELKVTENLTKCYLPFHYTIAPLEIIFREGSVIACNGMDLSMTYNINRKSIISVINALSTTTSGLSVTLSKTAVNREFETSTGANNGSTSTEWITLIATKNNWNIVLA